MTVFVIKNMRFSIKKDRKYRLMIEKNVYFNKFYGQRFLANKTLNGYRFVS